MRDDINALTPEQRTAREQARERFSANIHHPDAVAEHPLPTPEECFHDGFTAGLAYSSPEAAVAEGHRVELSFDDGLYAKLICPESGCSPAGNCSQCGRDLHPRDLAEQREEGIEPCYDCKDAEKWSGECWIKTWFDNLTAEELLHGKITFPIDAEWDMDHIVVHIVEREAREASPPGPAAMSAWDHEASPPVEDERTGAIFGIVLAQSDGSEVLADRFTEILRDAFPHLNPTVVSPTDLGYLQAALAASRDPGVPAEADQSVCSYCGKECPAPVELHHHESECTRIARKPDALDEVEEALTGRPTAHHRAGVLDPKGIEAREAVARAIHGFDQRAGVDDRDLVISWEETEEEDQCLYREAADRAVAAYLGAARPDADGAVSIEPV